jgi:hypothetical protein
MMQEKYVEVDDEDNEWFILIRWEWL